jgi:hypothetical protein
MTDNNNDDSKAASLAQYISPDDLTTFRHAIILRNDTSGTSINDESKLSFVEFLENGAIFRMPRNSCQVGHILTLFIFQYPLTQKINYIPKAGDIKGCLMEIIGKVSQIWHISQEDAEKLKDTKGEQTDVCVQLIFSQFNEVDWARLVAAYRERQDRIDGLYQRKV